MNDKKTMLAIVAHPDDEVLGCGGTLAKLAGLGNDVYVAVLGEGITSRYEDRESADGRLVEELAIQTRKATSLLGVRDVFMFNLPDNRFDTVPLIDIVKIIEKLIHDIRPSTVYTHHEGDLNIDHQIVNRATVTATRPIKGHLVRELFAFSVLSSSEWSFRDSRLTFTPNYFVDISETLDRKLEALSIYKSEVCEFPHPRSIDAVAAFSKYWGSVVGCNAAEPFSLIRAVS